MMMESKETDRQTTCRAHYDNLPFFFFIYLRYAIHFIVFLFLWNHLSYAASHRQPKQPKQKLKIFSDFDTKMMLKRILTFYFDGKKISEAASESESRITEPDRTDTR